MADTEDQVVAVLANDEIGTSVITGNRQDPGRSLLVLASGAHVEVDRDGRGCIPRDRGAGDRPLVRAGARDDAVGAQAGAVAHGPHPSEAERGRGDTDL